VNEIMNEVFGAGVLPSWRNSQAKRSVMAFLRAVTQGAGALPVWQRVAAFDFDGTLACEKPHTALAEFLLDRGGGTDSERVRRAVAGGGHDVLRAVGVVFAGRTVVEYEEQAGEFLGRAVHPRFGDLYPNLTYQPMLELIGLMRALEFNVFICTDSSRDFIRVIAEPILGLRREQIIGSEVQIESIDGVLVRTPTLVGLDDGPGKAVHLWDRTGRQPLFAAGNAAGDMAMLKAARYALVVRHDDAVREYAYDDEQILDAAAANEWTVLSMRDDFTHVWRTGHGGGVP
jgi:phosphoserine phosphatase